MCKRSLAIYQTETLRYYCKSYRYAKTIFVSAFNSAPISIDNDFALYGKGDLFQEGLDIVSKLTTGTTHLNVDGYSNPSKVFTDAKGVQIIKFQDHILQEM